MKQIKINVLNNHKLYKQYIVLLFTIIYDEYKFKLLFMDKQ